MQGSKAPVLQEVVYYKYLQTINIITQIQFLYKKRENIMNLIACTTFVSKFILSYVYIYKVTILNQVQSRKRLNLLRLMSLSFAVIDKSFQRDAAE
jgi:hypothetical protein